LKLLFTKKTLPHDQCIKVRWPPEDRDLSWVSLFLVPTEEDKRKGWSVGTESKETFLEFLRACTPPNSYTYALLAPGDHEHGRMLNDLRASGLRYMEEKGLARKKRLLHNWLKPTGEGYIYVSGVDWRFVPSWFENYIGWTSVPYMFVFSSKPLENWEKELMNLKGPIVKEFLRKVELLVWNHFDHGIEAAGFHVRIGELEAAARDLSQKLNMALEVRETGQPF